MRTAVLCSGSRPGPWGDEPARLFPSGTPSRLSLSPTRDEWVGCPQLDRWPLASAPVPGPSPPSYPLSPLPIPSLVVARTAGTFCSPPLLSPPPHSFIVFRFLLRVRGGSPRRARGCGKGRRGEAWNSLFGLDRVPIYRPPGYWAPSLRRRRPSPLGCSRPGWGDITTARGASWGLHVRTPDPVGVASQLHLTGKD